MLDIRLIRRDPDAVRAALARRGPEAAAAVDTAARARRALASADHPARGAARRAEPGEQGPQGRADARGARAARGARRSRARAERRGGRGPTGAGRRARVAAEPPRADAPDEDTVLKEVGEAGKTGKDHLELAGPRIDMERGANVSGSRFAYLQGDLVLLEFALVRYALEKLMAAGFEPVIPPVLVRERALYGTGFLPDTEQQIYRLADDDLYLVGTSEVPLASLHANEILAARRAAAPLRRLLDLLSPRGRRGRQGHPRHLPRAPVRQGRDVLLRRAGGRAGRARAAARRSRSRSSRSSRSPIAWSRSRSTTSAPRRRRSTTARRGCPARAATAS